MIAACLGATTRSHAQAPELQWRAPPQCPSREAWLAELSARVDPDVFRAQAPKLRVMLEIETTPAGYSLALSTELDGVRGERRIEAALCSELTHAAALIVALALDPSPEPAPAPALTPTATAAPTAAPAPAPTLAPTAPSLAPAPAPVASPAPVTVPEPPPAPSPRAGRPLDPDNERPQRTNAPPPRATPDLFFARSLAAFDLGVLPKLALGVSLQAGVRLGSTSLELGGSYLPTQSLSIDDREATVGELRLLTGSLGACHGLSGGRLELAPCVRAELGRLWGRGQNLGGGSASGGATWFALSGGVKLSLRTIDPLWLVLELAAGAPLLAASFGVEGLGQAHETPAVFGRLSAGVELTF